MKLTARSDRSPGLLMTHLWLVVLATVVSGLAALVAVSAKPVTYTATAEVVVAPVPAPGTPATPDMGTERAIARSGVVVERAASALGVDAGTVHRDLGVSVVLESWVLHISYTASNPGDAYRGASVVATSYVDYRNRKGSTFNATMVTPPSLPTSGSRGSLPLYLVLGLIAGLALGIAAAWVWDRVSDRVRSAPELTRLTGLPVLARMRRWERRTRALLPSGGQARASFAFVAARLTAMTGHGGGKTIVVTSPRAGAGTTTVACGTAVALAAQGKKVVLVAACRSGLRPERVFGTESNPGLVELLSGDCPPEAALHPTSVRNLSVVPVGGLPGEGLELETVHMVLEKLESRAFLVVDAPPVLTSADALLLADVADLVVLVGDLRSGTRADLRETMALLHDLGPRLAGWVSNVAPRRPAWRRHVEPPQATASRTRQDPVAEVRRDEAPAEGAPAGSEPDRVSTVRKVARLRPDTRPPAAPTTRTPAPDVARPARAPAAASRPR